MGFRRAAVVMAGGSGTRFWPVSTEARPKQFLNLASPSHSLLRQSVDRIAPLVGEDVFVATASSLVGETLASLPGLAPDHVFGEPMRRNTLGALVWATAHIHNALGGDVSLAVLTADHMIAPEEGFRETVSLALDIAEARGSLVTIGIPASRAATEYGYIEKGGATSHGAWRAKRFTEKPDAVTAAQFVASGEFLWNSGMFFWTLPAFEAALERAQPEAARVMGEIALRLRDGDTSGAADAFASLEGTSIDYALMEKAENVEVVAARFAWDDLGSWDALTRSLELDGAGNAVQGRARLVDTSGSVVYGSGRQRINVMGMDDVVVVATDDEVMVCPKDRAQDVRKLAD